MEKIWNKVGLTDSEYELIKKELGREPNLTELSLYGVMWSEHCGYKNSRPLFKHFPTTGKRVLQGPGENAGIIDIGDEQVITMKVESHNHPSAIAPYQGAATGVGGIIRDILAMGAFPIAVLDSLSFGNLEKDSFSKHLMREVVAGIGDYGNCVGIPNVGGEVRFSDKYKGNPLVNAMCVGLMDKADIRNAIATGPGNSVMIVGNLTGRDGIGGASFASKELDEETESEDKGAVQVGDPFMEKLLIEACLEAFKMDYVIGVQDMGAAGIISSTSETASKAGTGIEIDVSLVPTREKGMSPAEIMISESQERMLLIVQQGKEDEINKIFHKWDLHAVVIGKVTDDGMIRVLENGKKVAEVPAKSLSNAPTYRREGTKPTYLTDAHNFDFDKIPQYTDFNEITRKMIANPNISSKRWVYNQYDHMIQLNSITHPGGDGAVLRIKGKNKAIALTLDSNGRYVYLNPNRGSELVMCEAARNLVATGATPIAITDGLNFGNPEKSDIYYQFEQSIIGISNACKKLDTPVISGNVSFYNETPENGAIYPTPIIGMVGLINDLDKIASSEFKNNGDVILLVGETKNELGASEYLAYIHNTVAGDVPSLDWETELNTQKLILNLIDKKLVNSVHDVSDGGLAIAVIESAINGNKGAFIDVKTDIRTDAYLFGESQSRFIISANNKNLDAILELAQKANIHISQLGNVIDDKIEFRINNNNAISLTTSELKDLYENSIAKILEQE